MIIPHMSNNEIQIFEKYLKQCTNYFEYGSGGSTFVASSLTNIQHMCTVEANSGFINDLVSKSRSIQQRLQSQTIVFYIIDIHCDTNHWSYPKDTDKKENWSKYPEAIGDYIGQYMVSPDFILVDGRFRVACVIQVIKHLSEYRPIIAVHDYRNRQCYNVIEPFLDILEEVDTLVVFRVKERVDKYHLEHIYNHFKNDVR